MNQVPKILAGVALGLIAFSKPFPASASAGCAAYQTEKVGVLLHDYMKANRLIRSGDESKYANIGVETRWDLLKTVASGNDCLAVMAICTFTGKTKECDQSAFEVIGLRASSGNEDPQIVPFEKVHPVAAKVLAKIGHQTGSDASYYYVVLSGKSAVEATKSVVAKVPYFGFSGTAVRGAKASYDPTPNRNWQIKQAAFSLRRGMSAEGLDIQAYQFDAADAEGYWKGCFQPHSQLGECSVAPWGQAYIRALTSVR